MIYLWRAIHKTTTIWGLIFVIDICQSICYHLKAFFRAKILAQRDAEIQAKKEDEIHNLNHMDLHGRSAYSENKAKNK